MWALLAFCFAAAPPLYAHADAPGEPRGLDLRDRYNRPVDRAAQERGLRAGIEVERRSGAALAGLPRLVALIEYLDRARAVSGLQAERRDEPARAALRALPPPRDPRLRALKPGTVAPVAPAGACGPLSPPTLSTHPGRSRVLPLRL